MKSWLRWLCFCLFAVSSLAHAASPTPIPELTSLLVDQTGALGGTAPAEPARELFADHPEWKVPFLLVVFSPFALFPLFFGRWGSVASGPMLACFIGAAAWSLWDSQAAGLVAGLLATGLAVMLFPGKPALVLGRVLASAMLFVFILTIAWVALYPFVPHPAGVSCSVAGAITALVAIGSYLESCGHARGSRWCFVLVLVVALPLGLLALVLSVIGEDLATQIAQGTIGGGSIAGALALAARHGVFAAVKIGLGGRFGGGGAGRQG